MFIGLLICFNFIILSKYQNNENRILFHNQKTSPRLKQIT